MNFRFWHSVITIFIIVLASVRTHAQERSGTYISPLVTNAEINALTVPALAGMDQKMNVRKRQVLLTFNTGTTHLLGANHIWNAALTVNLRALTAAGSVVKEYPV